MLTNHTYATLKTFGIWEGEFFLLTTDGFELRMQPTDAAHKIIDDVQAEIDNHSESIISVQDGIIIIECEQQKAQWVIGAGSVWRLYNYQSQFDTNCRVYNWQTGEYKGLGWVSPLA